MKIQTEHLENHAARLTVEVEPDRLEQAKQGAVRKIARSVNIPGFRKGKAPAHMVMRYVGEARVLEEALEDLGQTIYRETLDQAEVKPYGPGALEDVKYEPTLTFIYTVPLQPEVKLGDYRSVRLDFTEPVIEDAHVEQTIKRLRDQEAISENSEAPAAPGNRLTLDVHSFIVEDEDENSDEAEDEEIETDSDELEPVDENDDEDDHHQHDHNGEPFIHEHDLKVILREGDDEPIGPGFVAAMVGATVGETREFRISYPSKEENADISDEVAGKSVDFVVTVKQIENVTLPELNDEFATNLAGIFADPDAAASEKPAEISAETENKVSTEEDVETAPAQPAMTMEQFREKVRSSLYREAKQAGEQEYSDKVLDEIVKGAQVAYPDMMVEEQLDSMVQNLDQRLRQQGITLEQFMSLTHKSMDDVRNDYRTSAEEAIKRSLVLFEIAVAEKIQVLPEDYETHIERTMKRLGFDSPEFRKSFDNPSVRDNILNRLLQDKTFERIVTIGKGEAPELTAAGNDVAESDQAEATIPTTPGEE